MRNHRVDPAKMLICFLGRRRGDLLVEVAKAAGARGGTIAFGKSYSESRLLQALSLADVQQDVVFTVMTSERERVVAAIREAAKKDPRRLGGTAVLLDVPEFFIRAINGEPGEPGARSQPMESGYKLISVIVNTGFADDVMTAARTAGASGGSILTARGTGTEEDVKFFGITLVPEKEMLLIVAEKDKVKPIVEAIGTVPTLSQPGGGIVYTMNVEEFIVLGK